MYTPHLILSVYLFIIYGVISNALNHYLGLRSFIFGQLRVPVATSRPTILTKLLTVLLSPSRQVLVQYLKFGHDRFLPHKRILYSSFTIILPFKAVQSHRLKESINETRLSKQNRKNEVSQVLELLYFKIQRFK